MGHPGFVVERAKSKCGSFTPFRMTRRECELLRFPGPKTGDPGHPIIALEWAKSKCGSFPFAALKGQDDTFGLRSFGVEDYVEEEPACGGEDDVVADEELDPEAGIAFAGEDAGGGEDHG